VRVLGKVEPIFVAEISDMAQAVLDFVRDGDVVLVMGAGSISRIPAQLGEMA
jgi:UDP-N-acetylmuramate--alanine ligase